MINIFENNNTMIVDGLTYNQMIELQLFVHRSIFDKFHTLHYYKQVGGELKQIYQIVVEGSARYRNMLRVLADNPHCLEDTIKPEQAQPVVEKEPFPPTRRKLVAKDMSKCPMPWDY